MDDDLRRILGDADYEELSKKIRKYVPANLTPAQLASIEDKVYDFGFTLSGPEAVDLVLAWACAYKNLCEDCGHYLTDFLHGIVTEINFTMLSGVEDE